MADESPDRTRVFLLINGVIILIIGVVLLVVEAPAAAAYIAFVGGVVLLGLGAFWTKRRSR